MLYTEEYSSNFRSQKVCMLSDWPFQSTDLNPFETLPMKIDKKLYKENNIKFFASLVILIEAVFLHWLGQIILIHVHIFWSFEHLRCHLNLNLLQACVQSEKVLFLVCQYSSLLSFSEQFFVLRHFILSIMEPISRNLIHTFLTLLWHVSKSLETCL